MSTFVLRWYTLQSEFYDPYWFFTELFLNLKVKFLPAADCYPTVLASIISRIQFWFCKMLFAEHSIAVQVDV